MKTGRPPRRLRQRLFLSFLAFAVLPSLLLTWIAYRSIDASLDLWRTPAVSRALEGSVQVARQILADRRPAMEVALDSLIAGGVLPSPRLLGGTRFEAVGLATASDRDHPVWSTRPGHLELIPLLERRLARIEADTLVVAGPEHLALVRVRNGRRWIALSPLPSEVSGPLAEILKARSFYDELDDYRTVTRRTIGLASLGLLALLLVVAWFFARGTASGVTRPLEALARAMAAFSRGEHVKMQPAGELEVRELSASFETMRDDLARSQESLARAERTAAWREVARRIAHEIKNPLTPIRLAVHRLRSLEGSLPGAERGRLAESLDSVDREVETLRNMADTFSRFSRLPEPDRRRAALLPIVKSVAEMYDGSEVELEHRVDGDLEADVDEGQLRQALHNLIQNAADATGGRGPVRIGAGREARSGVHGVYLQVGDAGPGFGSEALARAGEPYFTQKTHGTGLGLAMVRRIAEGHGGSLAIGNAPAGGGLVEIWIPVKARS